MKIDASTQTDPVIILERPESEKEPEKVVLEQAHFHRHEEALASYTLITKPKSKKSSLLSFFIKRDFQEKLIETIFKTTELAIYDAIINRICEKPPSDEDVFLFDETRGIRYAGSTSAKTDTEILALAKEVNDTLLKLQSERARLLALTLPSADLTPLPRARRDHLPELPLSSTLFRSLEVYDESRKDYPAPPLEKGPDDQVFAPEGRKRARHSSEPLFFETPASTKISQSKAIQKESFFQRVASFKPIRHEITSVEQIGYLRDIGYYTFLAPNVRAHAPLAHELEKADEYWDYAVNHPYLPINQQLNFMLKATQCYADFSTDDHLCAEVREFFSEECKNSLQEIKELIEKKLGIKAPDRRKSSKRAHLDNEIQGLMDWIKTHAPKTLFPSKLPYPQEEHSRDDLEHMKRLTDLPHASVVVAEDDALPTHLTTDSDDVSCLSLDIKNPEHKSKTVSQFCHRMVHGFFESTTSPKPLSDADAPSDKKAQLEEDFDDERTVYAFMMKLKGY